MKSYIAELLGTFTLVFAGNWRDHRQRCRWRRDISFGHSRHIRSGGARK